MYHKSRMIPYLLLLVLLSTSAGCSLFSSGPKESPTAEALFKEGVAHFDNKRYVRAIDSFQRLRDEFPFAPQIIDAELKLAEAYYRNQQYPEAASAFKEFLSLHPTNENIPFVIYHLGLVYFDQFNGIDRDPKPVETAKGYFEIVLKDHPHSPYAQRAKEKLAQCLEYLAEHQFYIASFYLREEKYPAARDRFEEILHRYRETSTAVKALYHLGESYRLENNTVKAALAYEALLQHYPESDFAREAGVRLAEVVKQKQDPLALLLMRDGRPLYIPTPEGSQQVAESRKQKELNLIAKKEVVHEDPDNEKGVFGRMVSALNPLSWYSSTNDKKDANHNKKDDAAKEESPGFLNSVWRVINPFATKQKPQVEAPRDPELMDKIDAGLKQQGIEVGPTNLEAIQKPKAPIPDLPQATEAPSPPSANVSELVGEIDTKLKREGGKVEESSLPQKADPAVKSSSTKATVQPTAKAETPTPASVSGLLESIDARLKGKGIEPPKVVLPTPASTPREPGAERRTKAQEKIELETKLPVEKGPLFLGPGEFTPKEKTEEESK